MEQWSATDSVFPTKRNQVGRSDSWKRVYSPQGTAGTLLNGHVWQRNRRKRQTEAQCTSLIRTDVNQLDTEKYQSNHCNTRVTVANMLL